MKNIFLLSLTLMTISQINAGYCSNENVVSQQENEYAEFINSNKPILNSYLKQCSTFKVNIAGRNFYILSPEKIIETVYKGNEQEKERWIELLKSTPENIFQKFQMFLDDVTYKNEAEWENDNKFKEGEEEVFKNTLKGWASECILKSKPCQEAVCIFMMLDKMYNKETEKKFCINLGKEGGNEPGRYEMFVSNKGDGTCFFHELGHMIDALLLHFTINQNEHQLGDAMGLLPDTISSMPEYIQNMLIDKQGIASEVKALIETYKGNKKDLVSDLASIATFISPSIVPESQQLKLKEEYSESDEEELNRYMEQLLEALSLTDTGEVSNISGLGAVNGDVFVKLFSDIDILHSLGHCIRTCHAQFTDDVGLVDRTPPIDTSNELYQLERNLFNIIQQSTPEEEHLRTLLRTCLHKV